MAISHGKIGAGFALAIVGCGAFVLLAPGPDGYADRLALLAFPCSGLALGLLTLWISRRPSLERKAEAAFLSLAVVLSLGMLALLPDLRAQLLSLLIVPWGALAIGYGVLWLARAEARANGS